MLDVERAELHYPLGEAPDKARHSKHYDLGALIILPEQLPKHPRRHDGDQHLCQRHDTERARQSVYRRDLPEHFASSKIPEADFPAARRIVRRACTAVTDEENVLGRIAILDQGLMSLEALP